jgi:hypothetical protein
MLSMDEDGNSTYATRNSGLSTMGLDLDIFSTKGSLYWGYFNGFMGGSIADGIMFGENIVNGHHSAVRIWQDGKYLSCTVIEYDENTADGRDISNITVRSIVFSKDPNYIPPLPEFGIDLSGTWNCTEATAMTFNGVVYDLIPGITNIDVSENGLFLGYMEQNQYEVLESVMIMGQISTVGLDLSVGWYIDKYGYMWSVTVQDDELVIYSFSDSLESDYYGQNLTVKRTYSRENTGNAEISTIDISGNTYVGTSISTIKGFAGKYGTSNVTISLIVSGQVGDRAYGYVSGYYNGVYYYDQFDGYIVNYYGTYRLTLEVMCSAFYGNNFQMVGNISEDSFDATMITKVTEGGAQKYVFGNIQIIF